MDRGMPCQKCRFENGAEASYCSQCGIFLGSMRDDRLALPAFEEQLAKIQRYLPQGLTSKILTHKDGFEGERRRLTVMFCDLANFTALVDRLGDEAAYGAMGAIYEILIRHVHQFGGTINEMTGDGIMALFGAPVAVEEAPHRALWAAQAIHKEIARFHEGRPALGPLRMRIGVHSGPVVVGSLGNDLRLEFKAVGDTVNMASRMEQLAEPGATYVSHEVYRQTADRFAFERLGKRFIKGMAHSCPVYKVLSVSSPAHRPRLGSERTIFAAMVGRDAQLTQLETLARLVTTSGKGAIVNVIGEAGIGKTRLVNELRQRQPVRRMTVLEGRAMSMGRNLSFHPIVDMLRDWAGIREDDDPTAAFNRLAQASEDLLGNQSGEVLPFLAILMGIRLPAVYRERVRGITGEALENLIRRSVRGLLVRLSAQRPLMVIIDDLHWADKSSLELLEYLFRLTQRARILFINLFRPGYEETDRQIRSVLQDRLQAYTADIVLAPLDEKMSEVLIAEMLDLKGFHHAVVEEITRRAGGNPYFIEEVVRAFIDEGVIVLRDGKFVVTEKLRATALPNTINDVLMARIDRLEEDARDLLKTAAVIGRQFFYPILDEVAGAPLDVNACLAYLEKSGLILKGVRYGEVEYAFKHALAQEATYAAILPDKRKVLHARVAEAIEKVFADNVHPFYGMLAYHYGRAEKLEKAEEFLMRAGEAALKTSASSEALHYCLEALRLYRELAGAGADAAKVGRLEKNIALALFNRGQYEESIEYFDHALVYYWQGGAKRSRFLPATVFYGVLTLLTAMWVPWLYFQTTPSEKNREAVDLFYRKLKALGIIDPPRFFLDSLSFYRGLSRFDLTHFDVGYALYVSASSLFSFSGLSFGISKSIMDSMAPKISRDNVKAYIIYDFVETLHHYLVGNWGAIKPVDQNLVNENLHIGEVYFASLHLHWHGLHHLHQGNLTLARNLIGQLKDVADIYENEFSQLLKLLLNTGMLLEGRRLEDALSETEAAIDFAKRIQSGLGLIHFLSCRAHIRLLAGDPDAAEETLQHAEAVRAQLHPVPWQLSAFLRSRAELDLQRLGDAQVDGRKGEWRKRRKQAARSCRALVRQSRKVAQYRTDAGRLMAGCCWLAREPEAALRWWRFAMREGERLGARIQLARTYRDVGQTLSQARSPEATLDGITAEAYLEKADLISGDLEWDPAPMPEENRLQFGT